MGDMTTSIQVSEVKPTRFMCYGQDFRPVRRTAAAGVLTVLAWLGMGITLLHAQSNDWINPGSGKWEVDANWFLGAPAAGEDIGITNFVTKTVTIDGVTSTNSTSTMTVNSLTLISAITNVNTLFLANAGTNFPLEITSNLDLEGGSIVTVSNSSLKVDNFMRIGSVGSGILTLKSGVAQGVNVNVGDNSGQGTLNVNGGTFTIPTGTMTVAAGTGSSGTVSVTSGTLSINGGGMVLGNSGAGSLTVSGGTVQMPTVQLGSGSNSQGTMNLTSGTTTVFQSIIVGTNGLSNSCSVTLTNTGILRVTNASHNAFINVASNSALNLNGGTLQVDQLILTNGGTFNNRGGTFQYTGAFQLDNGGAVMVAGGTIVAATNIVLGSVVGSSGTLSVTAGTLTVTNGPILIGPVGSGQMTQSGGTVTAQSIQLGGVGTNGSGDLFLNGGHTIIQSNLNCNFVVVNGGDLDDGTSIIIGTNHDAQLQVMNGTVRANVYVGFTPGYTGTYTQSGGTVYVTNFMMVGDSTCGALGGADVERRHSCTSPTPRTRRCWTSAMGRSCSIPARPWWWTRSSSPMPADISSTTAAPSSSTIRPCLTRTRMRRARACPTGGSRRTG